MREIRTLRATWRGLETESRTTLGGHEGGNPRHRQGLALRITAPVLDPTRCFLGAPHDIGTVLGGHEVGGPEIAAL